MPSQKDPVILTPRQRRAFDMMTAFLTSTLQTNGYPGLGPVAVVKPHGERHAQVETVAFISGRFRFFGLVMDATEIVKAETDDELYELAEDLAHDLTEVTYDAILASDWAGQA